MVEPIAFLAAQWMKNMDNIGIGNVVFFDGVCGLCNRFVDYLLVADKKKKLRYAPLQGSTFEALKPRFEIQIPDSVVFYSEGKIYIKSTAALKILSQLGGWYVLLTVFYLIPTFLRDHIYDYVARNRYAWFGEKERCRLPTKEERALFLD